VPRITAIIAIIYGAVLSVSEIITIIGRASPSEIMLPWTNHGTPGSLMFAMIIDTKKYWRKADMIDLKESFWAIIGKISIVPAAIPMAIEINNALNYFLLHSSIVQFISNKSDLPY
jgi:hypothetical protein